MFTWPPAVGVAVTVLGLAAVLIALGVGHFGSRVRIAANVGIGAVVLVAPGVVFLQPNESRIQPRDPSQSRSRRPLVRLASGSLSDDTQGGHSSWFRAIETSRTVRFSFASKEKARETVRSALDPVVHVGDTVLALKDPGAL